LTEAQDNLKFLRQTSSETREEMVRYRLRVQELEQIQKEYDAKIEKLTQTIAVLECKCINN